MFVRSFLLATASCVALLGATAGAGMAQTAPAQTGPTQSDPSATAPAKDTMQGYGNFFRYRIDGLDPSIYDNPVLKVVQPRKFFIGEKADLTINVQGGNRPYAFSLIGPPLAQGLTFDPRLGNFVGTSKVPSEGTYVMAVQDAKGRISQSDPFVVTWLDDFDETQQHAYPVQAFVGDAALPSPQPIFDGSATTDVAANGFGATVAVHFDHPIRAKTAVVAFSTDADYGSCSYDLEAKDEDANWKPVNRAQSLASGGVLSAFNLMPTPRSGFVSADWRVKLTNSCHMRVSELRIASSPPNPPPAWQTPDGLLVAVGPVPLGVSVVAPEQSPYSDTPTKFELAAGSSLPTGFAIQPNGDLTGPSGDGFPYGRVDFTLRATDGIGYWSERKYYLTPDAVPARTAYPVSLGVGDGVDLRHAMNDGVTDVAAQSATVPAGGTMLFDYGRFVRVTGGTVLAGENVGQMTLEAEAGPNVWVAPSQVAGIAKRWRLVNESTSAATVREARLDAADYNHPPLWSTLAGPWIVGDSSMSVAAIVTPDYVIPGKTVPGFVLPLVADVKSIYTNDAAKLTLAPGATLPNGLGFDGAAFTLTSGETLPAGRLSTTIRATDALGYLSDQQFVFNPASVRANTVNPAISGPGGDVSMVLNDGLTDASVSLAAGDALVWNFGRYVQVIDPATVVADKPGSLVLEAGTDAGWVAPATVDGIAIRWRVRATAAVSLQEYRLDGASPILRPTFSPGSTLRTVDQVGVDGSGQLRLPVTATARNPYTTAATTVSIVDSAPAGFSYANGGLRVPAGESFPAGLVSVKLQAVDNLGVSSTQTYPFQPYAVRASTLVPQTRDATGADAYFVLYDGVVGSSARSVHLDPGQAITFTFARYASVVDANAVDATNPSALVFEAQTADGWVPAASVNSVAKAFRARATASVDVREYRLDGAPVPGAPTWSTSAGPYVADESRLSGQQNLALPVEAQVNNTLASPTPILSVQGDLPAAFGFSSNTITTPRGSNFAAGRQTVVLRASDSTGFFADRPFVFNPQSVPAQPIKPDVRDPAGNDVFGILVDGRPESGVALSDGQTVILDYGRRWVNASRPATVTTTSGTVAIEAETATGWVPPADVDWIAQRFRIRSVGTSFLSEARLDGLPAQSVPGWNNRYLNGPVSISDPTTITASAYSQSTFSDGSITYSVPSPLPTGFSFSGNVLSIPAGETLPAGYTPIVIRATDSVGVYSDLVVPLQPDAPRAIDVRSSIVDPSGKDVYTVLTDGVAGTDAPGVQLAVGDTVVFDYGRYVYLFAANAIDASATVVLEAETKNGWVASGTVNNRAKRFRLRATAAGLLREARLDGLEVQRAPVWVTAGTLRTIDQAGLKLDLSTTLRSRFGSPITYGPTTTPPTGFSVASAGTIVAPAGESFPTGFVSLVIRATDAVGFFTDQTFSFAPATVRASTLPATSILDPAGNSVIQVFNDDVKGASAPGVSLTSGQTVVWTFPRYVKIVPSASVVDATNVAALVLETDGGSAGWVAASALDTGKRFRIRATAATTVREYRLDGVGAYVLPTYATAAGSYETSSTAVSGQTGLALQVSATNNSPFAGAMTYALVPGTTLPSGFSLSADGTIAVASADVFPAGKVSVPVRASDPVGNTVDRTFVFHPLGASAATVAPKTIVDGSGQDARVAMLDGRTGTSDASIVLSAGQSLVYDYGTQWVRIAAASTFDVVPTGAVLETVASDGSWVQMTAAPATSFPAAVQDQGGRRFRIRQVTGSSTLREARLGGLPQLGPVWTTAATARSVSQTTIQGVSPDSLTLQVVASKSSVTGSPVSYAWAPIFTPPDGFAMTTAGALTAPQGESFPYGRIEAAVRATTDDYTADRTFVLNPATVRLGTVAPTSVLDKSGNSVVVPLYDGATGTSATGVTLAAGDTIVWTFPRYVQNAAAAITDGVNLGNVVLEVERTSGEWVVPTTMDSIGRRWRLRATGAATLREYRLDGAGTFLSPAWVTTGGSRVVTATAITGTSPAALSMQLQVTNRSLRPTDPLSFALAPGSAALPVGFSLSSSGLLTAPSAPDFTAGTIGFVIRVTDTLGFFTDQAFTFTPEVLAMTAQLPSSVTAPDGSDVFVALYSGLNDTTVPLAPGQSITYAFPRYVSPTGTSLFTGLAAGPGIVLETPAQDGSWTTIFTATSTAAGPAGTTATTAYGKVYRLRNIGSSAQPLTTARLGGVPALAPVWTTPVQTGQFYGVNQTTITYTQNSTKVGNGLQLQLAATMQASGGTALSYAPSPGTTLPAGFSVTSGGLLTVPPGESFPGALPMLAIRVIDSKGFYNDRTFPFYPVATTAASTLPSSVTGPDGSDAFTVLYDGNTDRSVSLAPGEAIAWTFPNYVSVTSNAVAVSTTTGSATLQLQNLRADGTWAATHSYAISGTTVGQSPIAGFPAYIGRQWRLVNVGSTGTAVLSEFRLDGSSAQLPSITTSTGPWEVNQTQIVGASPAALSLQLAASKTYTGSTNAFTWSIAPNSMALPANFGLSASGLVVVPQGDQFGFGNVQLIARSTDSRGFYADKTVAFFPTSTRAATVAPSSVVDAAGNDVYSILYDGASDRSVSIEPGAAITFTFPQFVNLQTVSTSSLGLKSAEYAVLARQLQDGSWQSVEVKNSGQQLTLQSTTPGSNVSKVYRLQNAAGTALLLSEYRLDASIVRTPSWSTPATPYFVSESIISTTSGGAVVAGSNGLTLQVAAASQSSATGLVYSQVPGTTLPSGYAISSTGLITVGPASLMQSGHVDVAVRATDGHGLYSDRVFQFVPTGAPRANTIPPVAVAGPGGENLLPVVYDGRNDTSFSLPVGASIVFAWDRIVQIAADPFYNLGTVPLGGVYTMEGLQQDGSWKQIGGLGLANNGYGSQTPAGADQFVTSVRIRNSGSTALPVNELRMDGAPSYGMTIATSTSTRVVDTAIAGTNPASLSMSLSASGAHPRTSGMTWSLTALLPIGFNVGTDGTLTVPAATDFPFGFVQMPVQVQDNLGFTAIASYGFRASSVAAKSVTPVSVQGPSNEDLFRTLYDGRGTTNIALSPNQSITYTFDRFVALATIANQSIPTASYDLVVETPNQNGGWSVAMRILSGTISGPTIDAATSKIFRVRNNGGAAVTINDFPLDGAAYLGPTITTAGSRRIVDASTIQGVSPAGLTLQLAATDNYSGAGTLTWSLDEPLPPGFSITGDGVLTVPAGPNFATGNVTALVRVTDKGGFYQQVSFYFSPASVAAKTVPPVSVLGPDGSDLFPTLYDGQSNTISLADQASITFTYDRYVSVSDLSVSMAGYAVVGDYNLTLEVPNQTGGWTQAGAMRRYNGGANSISGVTQLDYAVSKVFRFRNIVGNAQSISELRLDNPDSYGLTLTQGVAVRTVDQNGISGMSPAGFGLQLGAVSGYPGSTVRNWATSSMLPDGFTLTSDGLITVPAGADFQYGYVAIAATVTDARNFAVSATYPFIPASVRAQTVMPVSVVGSNGEDLRSTLYDGNAATTYTLATGAAVTYTYDRYVSIQDVSTAAAGYSATMPANGPLYIEVPTVSGTWMRVITLQSNGAGWSSTAINAPTYNQSKVFRVRNASSGTATLAEFRLDNPQAYGLTWSQGTGPYYVSDTSVSATNGGTPSDGTNGLSLPLTAVSGYPGGSTVSYAWAPGFSPPDGFAISGSLLTFPAGSSFPAGTVTLQIRAIDSFGFASLTRTFTLVPSSVRANAVIPASVIDASGNNLLVGLYDYDASTSGTNVATLTAGQSLTWTYPQWVSIGADPFTAYTAASTTLYLERQLQDGSWQVADSKSLSTGVVGANLRGDRYPSKVWRLRNGGSVAATVSEWRIDAPSSYAPTLSTSLAVRYVTPTSIVDANGGSTASAGTSGLTLQLAGAVASPGGGALTYAWAPGFTPPDGYSLTSTGALTVPARDSMPTGQPLLSFALTDPRGFAITRVVPFVADTVRASSRLIPGTAKVVGPNGTDLFNKMVDQDPTAAATLQPNDAVIWTFDRYVSLASATAAKGISAATWQLEMPAQVGGWTAVENSTGLLAGTKASMTYRLRNTGTSAITVSEYAIDGAPQGNSPSLNYSLWSDGRSVMQPSYSGTAYSAQIVAVQNDPYYPSSLVYTSAGTLPDGVSLSSTGVITVAAGRTIDGNGLSFPMTITNGLGRSTSVTLAMFDKNLLVGIGTYNNNTTRYYYDGTYAVSCAAYTQGLGLHAYAGATGDGTYRIDPDGPGPVQPTDVACSSMSTSAPVTTIPAMVAGAHGYPGVSTSSTKFWVLPEWQSFYLALANVSNTQSMGFGYVSQNTDPSGIYSYSGAQLSWMTGYSSGGTLAYSLNKNSANAFWKSTYYTDDFFNGGPGLTITSTNVNFY
ncbi:putative Ig domain-containing protein [Methylobacterium fujisawaense]